MLTLNRFLHKLSLLMSNLAEVINNQWLWEKGGNFEYWCDVKYFQWGGKVK